MSTNSAGRQAKERIKEAAREAAPWVELLARLGFAAKGLIYGLMGLLALLVAGGYGNATAGPKGVLQALASRPLGVVVLAAAGVALAGHGVWCFIQALFDTEHMGRDPKALARRAALFFEGVVDGLLAWLAFGLIVGAYRSSENEDAKGWTAALMSWPWGCWLVGLVGAGFLAFGLFQVYRGVAGKLDESLCLWNLDGPARRWVVCLSCVGVGARGVVFGMIGAFLLYAAATANPREARSLAETLGALREQGYGPWLLVAAGAGLIAYGGYEFLRARYRTIRAA